jgi:hypothetical protein
MRTYRSALFGLGLLLTGPVLIARADVEPTRFEHYQVIIDRSPFGAISGGGEAAPAPNWAERYTFAGLVPSAVSNQLLIVIHDSARNRATLVAEGDTLDEIKIVKLEAKGEAPKVTIQKGLEVAALQMKTRDTPIAGVPSGPPPVQPARVATAAPGQVVPAAPPGSDQKTVVMPARRRIPFRRGE